jgi:hypothetical protein
MKRDLNDDKEFEAILRLFDSATNSVRAGDVDGVELALKEILERLGGPVQERAQ